MIDHPFLRTASWSIVAGLFAAGAYAIPVDPVEGAVLLGLAVLSGIALYFQRALPSSIMLLLIMAATVNAAGYIVGLWHERTMFDEIVHAFTTFAGMTAVTWMATRDGRLLEEASAVSVVAAALVAGLVLGMVWEGFEWLIGIIGNQRDTLIDLAMDSLGAVAAGLLFTAYRARRPNLRPAAKR